MKLNYLDTCLLCWTHVRYALVMVPKLYKA